MVVVGCIQIGVDQGCSLMRCNYLESNCDRYSEKFRFRDRCERVLFLRNGKGTVYLQIPCLLQNFEMPKWMFTVFYLFVYALDWSSLRVQAFFVFVCCCFFFYAKLRNALGHRSRPTKKRKPTCACSACHTLHTASYDLTNRSTANRATPISITMETPLITRRDNCSFKLEFCRFTVSTLGVLYFLWQERNSKKSQTNKIPF